MMSSSSSMRRWGSIAILATCGGFPILDLHRTTQHSIRWKEGHHSYLGDIWPILNIRPRPTSLTSDNLPTKHHVSIPDICQFWYTATLLRPVKKAPKRALICDKMAKIGQNSMQIENCTLPSVLAAVTNISYADCLAGLIPVLNNLTF